MNSAREIGARFSPDTADVFTADWGKATGDETFPSSIFASDSIERLAARCDPSWSFAVESNCGLEIPSTKEMFGRKNTHSN